MEKIRPLHYSVGLIEQLEAAIPTIRKDMPGILAAHHLLIELLRESIKFLLPNRAELIDMTELRQAHVDMARLPYPVVAMEATWFLPDGEGGDKSGGKRSSRRISLCTTMTPELANRIPDTADFLKEEQGGVLVIPLYWEDATARWRLPMGGIFIPYMNEVRDYVPGEVDAVTQSISQPFIDAGLPLRQLKHFRVQPFVLLPEMVDYAMNHQSREQVTAQILQDARDEIAMMIQTGVVLNCSNISSSDLAAPTLLNKKRKAKGKQPFFSYRVLQVSGTHAVNGSGGVGQHASPRAHLRRGHIRRLGERTVWVRPAMVNLGVGETVGKVEKEYAITSRNQV